MNAIYEVTGWREGLVGNLVKPLTVFVWAKNATEAQNVATAHWRALAVVGLVPSKWRCDTVSSVPARKQDPAQYGSTVANIVNLPMEKLQAAWDLNKVPEASRTQRPTYVVL